MFSLVHPEDLEAAATGLGAVLDGTRGPEAPIELRLRSADDTYWDFECVGENLGDLGAIGGVVITARNITQRKRTEAALREAQERFRAAFEHAPLCLAILNIDGTIHDVNPSGCAMLGGAPLPSKNTASGLTPSAVRNSLEDLPIRCVNITN